MTKSTTTLPAVPSPGLAFMQATVAAIPKSLGDRVRIALMNDTLKMAVQHKFVFDLADGPALNRMQIYTCVGVFDPLREHYYPLACKTGGTFARMWEKHNQLKPWIAARALYDCWHRRNPETSDGRVANSIPVLLPLSFQDGAKDAGLDAIDGQAVWWVTGTSKDHILLCRYPKDESNDMARYGIQRSGKPARRAKLTRDVWDALQASIRELSTTEQDKKAA